MQKKDCSWLPLNKHARNILLSSLRIRAHLSWRTRKHLHVLHVLRTYSTCSYIQDSRIAQIMQPCVYDSPSLNTAMPLRKYIKAEGCVKLELNLNVTPPFTLRPKLTDYVIFDVRNTKPCCNSFLESTIFLFSNSPRGWDFHNERDPAVGRVTVAVGDHLQIIHQNVQVVKI